MTKKIKWGPLWRRFDRWCENPKTRCATCGKPSGYFPHWAAQKREIQRLIEEAIK